MARHCAALLKMLGLVWLQLAATESPESDATHPSGHSSLMAMVLSALGLTKAIVTMDFRIRQTIAASPAEPGNSPTV
jgi:hypothetical protein